MSTTIQFILLSTRRAAVVAAVAVMAALAGQNQAKAAMSTVARMPPETTLRELLDSRIRDGRLELPTLVLKGTVLKGTKAS